MFERELARFEPRLLVKEKSFASSRIEYILDSYTIVAVNVSSSRNSFFESGAFYLGMVAKRFFSFVRSSIRQLEKIRLGWSDGSERESSSGKLTITGTPR